jgi:hypothetical protein
LDQKAKALAPRKNLVEFVDIVKKNNLARKSFAPFTDYVASFWPDKPEEFFAQSYATWRNDPNYMKAHARPLYEWFQKGGHMLPKKTVFHELAREVKLTFPIGRLKELIP